MPGELVMNEARPQEEMNGSSLQSSAWIEAEGPGDIPCEQYARPTCELQSLTLKETRWRCQLEVRVWGS